jgi:5'-nucleotidase
MRPLILLSNDDGYASLGIRKLRQALQTVADVIVCAPASEQSATSHSITLNRPLRLSEPEPGVFMLDGTPGGLRLCRAALGGARAAAAP